MIYYITTFDRDPMTAIADEKKEHNIMLQKRTVEMEHVSICYLVIIVYSLM